MASYFSDQDGIVLCDSYNDGDAEPSEMPSELEVIRSWVDYWEYVARTGHDILRQVLLSFPKRLQRWEAMVRSNNPPDHGLRVVGIRRNSRGPFTQLSEVPSDVRLYLTLGGTEYGPEFLNGIEIYGTRKYFLPPELSTFDALREALSEHKTGTFKPYTHDTALVVFSVEATIPWTDARIKRHIRSVAKHELKSRREQLRCIKGAV